MRRLPRLTEAARLDRRRIRSWFRQPGSGPAAKERLARLEKAMADVAAAPYAHPAGPSAGTRVLISQRHRIVFRIIPGHGADAAGIVEILRIYGPGQAGD